MKAAIAVIPGLAVAAALFAPVFVVDFDTSAFARRATSAAAHTQLWLLSIAVQAVAWVFIAAWLVAVIRRLRELSGATVFDFVISALPVAFYVGMLVLLTYFSRSTAEIPPRTLGPYSIKNMPSFGAVGLLVATLCVCAMYWTRLALESQPETEELGGRVERFMELHALLRWCLLAASLTLGLGTLAPAALRNAVNAFNAHSNPEAFPAEYVIAYGLMNSLFLMLAFGPVQWFFLRAGRALARTLAGDPGATADSIAQWHERGTNAAEMLGVAWTGAVSNALLALVPAILGWLSKLLGSQ